jgi:prolyl-tRNA synthetase
MRMSKLFSQTLRDIPAEAEVASHQLLLRAGFIRQTAAGIFSFLPLGRRTLDKIAAVLRQEMNAIGGQEISMPVVNPASLWKESGRWYAVDAELGRFTDRAGREMVLAMTHEESLADLVRKELRSYRQLPALLYHIQTKWRDDPRPRAGLIRVREFLMKDSYSLDVDQAGLDRQYQAHYDAYFRIFQRWGLPARAVGADVGVMGGDMAHEFIYPTPIGEDTLILCDDCGYAANRQIARFTKTRETGEGQSQEAALPLEKVATPGAHTIAELAAFLNIPASHTAKAVFIAAELPSENEGSAGNGQGSHKTEIFAFVIIRGDMEVNETKLARVLGARALRPATEEEIRLAGAVPGYASPVGLAPSRGLPVRIVVDDLIPASPNLVSGANEEGFHLLNVNYGRDYEAHIVADIAAAQSGDACPTCGRPLRTERGVELANIFKLGTHYSEPMGCTFNDRDGLEKPVVMGSYGIGLGRLMACIAEEHHDDYGLKWPASVAPYHVHLVLLAGKGGADVDTAPIAEQLYCELEAGGIEVLFDDREESPGIKFNDADLIGLPVRLTVSTRALKNGGVEFKRRDSDERVVIALGDVIAAVQQALAD